MSKLLKKKTEEWKALERKTIKQRQQADLFYESQLMSLIEAEFVKNNAHLVFEPVEALIMSVGTSYEPIALNYRLLRPEKALFLYTEKSEPVLGKIIQYCGIRPEKYEKRRVNETDPMDIYREIKEFYLKWNKPDKIYIDFTGGTKAMSAACALAGAMIDGKSGFVTPLYNQQTASRMLKTLVGREDLYAYEDIDTNGRRQMHLQSLPITEKVLREHLAGNITAGTYIQRPNGTVKYMVFDVDVSKKISLQYDRDSGSFRGYLSAALHKACDICKHLEHMGLHGYIEYSGNRGYHVWVFLTEWMSVRYANLFCEMIETHLEEDDNISIEMFPNKTRIKSGKFGQVIKLPYGVHIKTGERSCFLDDNLEPVEDINLFLDGIAKYTIVSIKQVLASQTKTAEKPKAEQIDSDITAFGELEAGLGAVLTHCNLLRYLCQKANKTNYLNHFERLTLLYVFGHMGEPGERFLHQVMSFTLNYSYNTTERFIRKKPEKPVSCIKLRDQYKKITAEAGCSCVFKRAKNCYPSPVLHAISRTNEENSIITLPTSKSLSKENAQSVMDEMNYHKKAQNLAKQIQDIRKQKRSLDRNIKKCEGELQAIFEQAKVDRLEVDMGLLVRRKTENGYEWVIEI